MATIDLQPTLKGPDFGTGIDSIIRFFTGGSSEGTTSTTTVVVEKSTNSITEATSTLGFKIIANLFWALDVLIVIAILYHLYKIYQFERIELEPYDTRPDELEKRPYIGKKGKDWEKAIARVDSSNPNDWKIAILEADTILDELLVELGYDGANLGERLRGVDRTEMATLTDAWEAHKIRNKIAHEGSAFELNYNVAKKTMEKFEKVFREFDYI